MKLHPELYPLVHMKTILRSTSVLALILVNAASAHAADQAVRWLSFAKDQPVPASVTLLPLQGKTGRENAFYDGYRPQLQFAGTKNRVTCAIKIPQPQDKVEPGETAAVTIRCIEDFKALEKEPTFMMFEGGRKVGEGTIKPS